MSARLRFTFMIEGPPREVLKGATREALNISTSAYQRHRSDLWNVAIHDQSEKISFKRPVDAKTVSDNLNETYARMVYAFDNPDTAVMFVGGIAQLIAVDDSGVDHEVLFKLGGDT